MTIVKDITDDDANNKQMVSLDSIIDTSNLPPPSTSGPIIPSTGPPMPPPKPCSTSNINKRYYFEKGDFFPFVMIKMDGSTKILHNCVNDNEFMFIHVKNIDLINKNVDQFMIKPNINYYIFYKEGEPQQKIKSITTKDPKFYKLFKETDSITVYKACPNRKIHSVTTHSDITELNELNIQKQPSMSNIPYLLVEDVLSDDLLARILKYYDDNTKKHVPHYTSSKNRLHIHPDKNLEREIDNKLSRSLYPEIKKVFYFDINYRENYKICCYDAETGGRFHPHRDTVAPYQHRRYAMSLFLNDDYEGGDFELPEYKLKIKPKKNCAVIFPGICSHKVNTVTKGKRRVIISFFCSEIENKTKGNSLYTMKSDFFKLNKIEFSKTFPI